MVEAPATPLLVTLHRVLARERALRRNAALVRTGATMAASLAIMAVWRVYDAWYDLEPMPLRWAAALLGLVAVVGFAAAAMGARSKSEMEVARDIDRRLELEDRTASGLAASRGPVGVLAPFVIADAENALHLAGDRLEAAFPRRPNRAAWRVLWLSCLFAFGFLALAIAIHLLWVTPIGMWRGPRRPDGKPRESTAPTETAPSRKDGEPASKPKPENQPEKPSPAKPDEKKPAPQPGDIHVAVKMEKDEFDANEPVTAHISANASGELPGAKNFDVRVSIDGVENDTGYELRVDPSRTEGVQADVDLRRVPLVKLPAGEHTLSARLTTRNSLESHVSEPVKFRIRAPKDDKPKDDKGGGGGAPKQKEPPPPPPKQGGEPKKDEQKPNPPPPPLPPVALDKKVVVPLFGEGEEVTKKGLTLVLDPGGGSGTPPVRRPLEDALPGAKRRAEETVNSSTVPAADRDLVRRYFDLLEALRK